MYSIYKVEVNEKVYIGLTKHSIEHRMQEHLSEAFKRGTKTKFYNCLRKWGDYTLDLIDTAENLEKANLKEQYYIKKYDSFENGLNSTIGGDALFTSTKGKTYEEIYKGDTEYIENRKKLMSEKLKGRIISEEQKLNLSRIHKGKTISEEQKQKTRDTLGKKTPEEIATTKRRTSESLLNFYSDDENCRRMGIKMGKHYKTQKEKEAEKLRILEYHERVRANKEKQKKIDESIPKLLKDLQSKFKGFSAKRYQEEYVVNYTKHRSLEYIFSKTNDLDLTWAVHQELAAHCFNKFLSKNRKKILKETQYFSGFNKKNFIKAVKRILSIIRSCDLEKIKRLKKEMMYSTNSKEYYQLRGFYDKEEVSEMIRKTQRERSPRSVDYWIKRGFTLDEAKAKIAERSSNFSKIGHEKGNKNVENS